MIHVDSPEPTDLLVSLTVAPREPRRPCPRQRRSRSWATTPKELASALAEAYPDIYAVAERQDVPEEEASDPEEEATNTEENQDEKPEADAEAENIEADRKPKRKRDGRRLAGVHPRDVPRGDSRGGASARGALRGGLFGRGGGGGVPRVVRGGGGVGGGAFRRRSLRGRLRSPRAGPPRLCASACLPRLPVLAMTRPRRPMTTAPRPGTRPRGRRSTRLCFPSRRIPSRASGEAQVRRGGSRAASSALGRGHVRVRRGASRVRLARDGPAAEDGVVPGDEPDGEPHDSSPTRAAGHAAHD